MSSFNSVSAIENPSIYEHSYGEILLITNKEAYKIIKRLYNKTNNQLKSPSKKDNYCTFFLDTNGYSIDRWSVYRKIQYTVKKVKNNGYEFDTKMINPHVFRHTFASRCLEAGMSSTTVSKLLGHTTVRMTTNYIHSTIDDFETDVSLMEKI